MIGTIVQNILYVLLAVTIFTGLTGVTYAYMSRTRHEIKVTSYLLVLSLIAATAPYIGLFGTVWHIIQALSGIGNGNLNVAAIAKPIGEALYTTLWGLGSAIPALIAHRVIVLLLPDDEVTDAPEAEATATQEA